ncbi:hypothetical protein P152DRAFT_474177 [Eremomyces bilateralis CBS 781.70]|uniref:Uncharacterized protein n=1 Tax=Eremomyces bilateralis CBS 781.70 TaxID=1392243 RepID=A0A6G1G1E1_9PEZI|nr:uncharacterized protein P152DRAFT_474177 [Eremomyces bilateralis CBS 781.70]KAF1811927.1 hypothetical protein P152DRAFT_474177 [Eremomyces bilateralis CBS 781.70]
MARSPTALGPDGGLRDLVHELANLSETAFWETLKKAYALRKMRSQGRDSDDEDIADRLKLEDASLLINKATTPIVARTRPRKASEAGSVTPSRYVSAGLRMRVSQAGRSLSECKDNRIIASSNTVERGHDTENRAIPLAQDPVKGDDKSTAKEIAPKQAKTASTADCVEQPSYFKVNIDETKDVQFAKEAIKEEVKIPAPKSAAENSVDTVKEEVKIPAPKSTTGSSLDKSSEMGVRKGSLPQKSSLSEPTGIVEPYEPSTPNTATQLVKKRSAELTTVKTVKRFIQYSRTELLVIGAAMVLRDRERAAKAIICAREDGLTKKTRAASSSAIEFASNRESAVVRTHDVPAKPLDTPLPNIVTSTPVIQERKENKPADKQEAKVSKETMPIDKEVKAGKETMPIDKQEVEVRHETMPIDKVEIHKETVPIDKQETKVGKEIMPIDKQEVEASKENMPLSKQELEVRKPEDQGATSPDRGPFNPKAKPFTPGTSRQPSSGTAQKTIYSPDAFDAFEKYVTRNHSETPEPASSK